MTACPALSVVVPLYNEADNLQRLCEELDAALVGLDFEVLFVDDGSTDGSRDQYPELKRQWPWLRVVQHPVNAGQSAAFCTGVRAARAATIATMDGDLQNDPRDIPRLLGYLRQTGESDHVLVAGCRTRRQDSRLRRLSSRIANRVRQMVLHDRCTDTGCSLKLFLRDDYLLLPQFDHMHRFLPALFAREGVEVINVDVHHRARSAGRSKYGVGNRLWVGIVDLLGTRWLLRRRLPLPRAARQAPEELP